MSRVMRIVMCSATCIVVLGACGPMFPGRTGWPAHVDIPKHLFSYSRAEIKTAIETAGYPKPSIEYILRSGDGKRIVVKLAQYGAPQFVFSKEGGWKPQVIASPSKFGCEMMVLSRHGLQTTNLSSPPAVTKFRGIRTWVAAVSTTLAGSFL